MDIRKIKTLIEMLEESNLKEIEVSQGDESEEYQSNQMILKLQKIIILRIVRLDTSKI